MNTACSCVNRHETAGRVQAPVRRTATAKSGNGNKHSKLSPGTRENDLEGPCFVLDVDLLRGLGPCRQANGRQDERVSTKKIVNIALSCTAHLKFGIIIFSLLELQG